MAGSKMAQTRSRTAAAAKSEPNFREAFSRIFSREFQVMRHRAEVVQRIVKDPLYLAMNVTTASRRWMMKNLLHFADYTHKLYSMTLMEAFNYHGLEKMNFFMRYKNAPPEIVAVWKAMHLRVEIDRLPYPPPKPLQKSRVKREKTNIVTRSSKRILESKKCGICHRLIYQ